MSLVLNTNVVSLIAQNNLTTNSNSLNTSLQRLSSGLRINSAADDPAGLVTAAQQGAQIAGLQAAIQNTTTAGTLVQTADGALNEINTLLTNIRSLAVSSANTGVNNPQSLAANQAQVTNALQTIDRIASNTQFNTKNLLDGSAGLSGAVSDTNDVTFLSATDIGSATGANDSISITRAGTRAVAVASSAQTGNLAANETLTINGVAIQLNAGETQGEVIDSINNYSGQTGVQAQLGSGADSATTELYSTQFGSQATIDVQSNIGNSSISSGFGTAETQTAGLDIQGTIGGYAANGVGNVLTGSAGSGASGISLQFGLASGTDTATVSSVGASSVNLGTVAVENNSLVFQIGANANQTADITINSATSAALGVNAAGSQFANLSQINVESQTGSQDSILTIDKAISDVTNLEGNLGAFQEQTLQATSDNLNATLENTTAAQSAIQDTDFAAETANYTKEQVLLQAGTTVLADANQLPQLVLNLLK